VRYWERSSLEYFGRSGPKPFHAQARVPFVTWAQKIGATTSIFGYDLKDEGISQRNRTG